MEGHFYKDGKLLFKAHVIAGLVGITTGMRMNGYTLSIDTRKRNTTLVENIEYIIGNNTSFNIPKKKEKIYLLLFYFKYFWRK